MLTILAEENIQFTKDIVAIIEAQIAKVFMKIDLFLFRFSHRLLARVRLTLVK